MSIYNAEHQKDLTAFTAFGSIQQKVRTRCKRLTGVIFEVAGLAGIRVLGELHFQDKQSGYEVVVKCKEEEH